MFVDGFRLPRFLAGFHRPQSFGSHPFPIVGPRRIVKKFPHVRFVGIFVHNFQHTSYPRCVFIGSMNGRNANDFSSLRTAEGTRIALVLRLGQSLVDPLALTALEIK